MTNHPITIEGRLTADPELRFIPSGAAVSNFTVAFNDRKFNKQTNEWEDLPTVFMRCAAWRQLGENVAESLTRGDHVVVVGKLSQRSYDTKEGEKRTVIELEATTVAAALNFATVTVRRAQRGDTPGTQSTSSARSTAADDPWSTPAASAPPANDEPPF